MRQLVRQQPASRLGIGAVAVGTEVDVATDGVGLGLVLGGVALLVLLLGSGLSGFVPLAGVAVALWAAGYVADHFVAAGAHLPFDAITAIDDLGQRIEGLSGTGSLTTLRVPDRTDFLLLVSLASGQSAANAA